MKMRGSGLAIIYLIGGKFLNSIDPYAKTSRILALKPSTNSAGDNIPLPALKLGSKTGVIHKKVGLFKCACLPVGRECGLPNAEFKTS